MTKKIIALLLAITIIVSLTGCETTYLNSSNPSKQINVSFEKLGDTEIEAYYKQAEKYGEDVSPDVINHINSLGFDLLRASDNTDANVISPIGSYISLALLYSASSNSTKDEFDKVLGFEAVNDRFLNKNIQDLLLHLYRIDANTNIIYANSVYVPKSISGSDAFLDAATNYLFSKMTKIKFNETSKKDIDVWITNYTNHRFKTALAEISPETSTLAINAFHFEALTTTEFLPIDYFTDDFNGVDGIRTAEYQRNIGNYGFFEDDDVQILNVPLGRQKMSITFIIPKISTTKDLINKITNEDINNYISKLVEQSFELVIPQMRLQLDNDMSKLLQELGAPSIFATPGGLNGLSPDATLTQFVNKVGLSLKQSETSISKIDIYDEMTADIILEYDEFKVDRPFVFIIKDHSTDTNIMIGNVNNLGY
jgi:serpin B